MQEINENLYPNFVGYSPRAMRLMNNHQYEDLLGVHNCLVAEIRDPRLQSDIRARTRKNRSDPVIGAKLSSVNEYFSLSEQILTCIQNGVHDINVKLSK